MENSKIRVYPASEDGSSSVDAESDGYHVIDEARLEKEAWLARNQNLCHYSDIDFDGNFGANFGGEYYEEQSRRFVWYKNTVYDDVEQARLRPSVPSVFIRPTRYRRIGKSGSNIGRDSSVEYGFWDSQDRDVEAAAHCDPCDPNWFPQIRHTKKSRSMFGYLRIRACIIAQIDFIKQRDNVWSDKKIYGAVELLRKFIDERNFRYIHIPDHQRQWLEDMLKRVDQFYILNRPRKTAHLSRWHLRRLILRRKEQLREKCLRAVNPPYFEWLHREVTRVDGILAEERRRKKRKDLERRRNRMDWIEGRMTRWHQRIRPDRRVKPPEIIPPHISRAPYRDAKRKQNAWLLNVPHKPLVQVAEGIGEHRRMADSLAARDPRIFKDLDPNTGRIAATPKRPSKSTDDGEKPSQKSASRSKSEPRQEVEAAEPQVKSKDLSDVLELIQSIKTQQNKLKEELRELKRKRGMLTGKPEPETKEARPVSPSPYRLGCRPVYLAPLPAKDTLRTNHEVAHKVATVKHEASLAERSNAIRTRRENHIASLPEYEPKKKKAPKGTGSPLDGRAKDLLQEVYKEIHEAIDEYVDDLVRREFSNKGTDDDTDAETDPPN